MVGALSRGLWLLIVLFIALPVAAHGAAIGSIDSHHEDVDQSRYPWSAIGKVTNETGGSCSGVMISRDKVLTAAHCLYSYRARRFVGAEAIHFLLGYRAGHYIAHARVAHYQIGQGFDPERYDQTYDADWAILTMSDAMPKDVVPLALSVDPAPTGTRAMLAGYPQDRAQALTADRDCELRDRIDQGRLMLHTCRSAHGVSGAPILVHGVGNEIRIAGIQIATLRSIGATKMIAIPAQSMTERPGMLVAARAVLPGDPDDTACSADLEQVAALDTIRERIGLPSQIAQSDDIQLSDLGRLDLAKPKAVAWVMEDRFLFAVQ